MKAVSSKQEDVVRAATEVFLRYGFARTTMGDLAQAAGMSRPALYLVFPGKDDVFSAVIRAMNRQVLDDLRVSLSTLPTVGEKLLFACRNWGGRGYELVRQYPDSKDILDLSFASVREAYSDFQALLVQLLAEAGKQEIASSRLDELACVLIYSIRGFTEVAKDGESLDAMIGTQVRLLIHALEPQQCRSRPGSSADGEGRSAGGRARPGRAGGRGQ